jgi:protein-disulfide isomerase
MNQGFLFSMKRKNQTNAINGLIMKRTIAPVFKKIYFFIAISILFNQYLQAQKKIVSVKPMAVVHGEAIAADALNKAAAEDLENLELQREQMEAQIRQSKHDALESNLKRMIQDKLFSLEAAKRGITKEQLIDKEITDKVLEPSQQEIDMFYEANKNRIKESKEAITDRIKDYLKQQNQNRTTKEFVESLKKTYPVVINLQPLRYKVVTAGHPSKGPVNAPIVIIEFSDFQCTIARK